MSKLMAVVLSFFFSLSALAQGVPINQNELNANQIMDLYDLVETKNPHAKNICVFTPAAGVEHHISEGCAFRGLVFAFGRDVADGGQISVAIQDAEGITRVLLVGENNEWSRAKVISLDVEYQDSELSLQSTVAVVAMVLYGPPAPPPSSLARK